MAEQTRKLVIRSCTPVYTGNGAKGEYTIYEVKATDEQGNPIPHKLTSFANFAIGPGEFTVKPFIKGGVIESYTLAKPKGSGGGGSGASLQAVKSDLDLLVARVEFLEGKISEWAPLIAGVTTMLYEQQPQRQVPPPAPREPDPLTGAASPPQPFVDPGGNAATDDIPF